MVDADEEEGSKTAKKSKKREADESTEVGVLNSSASTAFS
jgi:hypothetical protein